MAARAAASASARLGARPGRRRRWGRVVQRPGRRGPGRRRRSSSAAGSCVAQPAQQRGPVAQGGPQVRPVPVPGEKVDHIPVTAQGVVDPAGAGAHRLQADGGDPVQEVGPGGAGQLESPGVVRGGPHPGSRPRCPAHRRRRRRTRAASSTTGHGRVEQLARPVQVALADGRDGRQPLVHRRPGCHRLGGQGVPAAVGDGPLAGRGQGQPLVGSTTGRSGRWPAPARAGPAGWRAAGRRGGRRTVRRCPARRPHPGARPAPGRRSARPPSPGSLIMSRQPPPVVARGAQRLWGPGRPRPGPASAAAPRVPGRFAANPSAASSTTPSSCPASLRPASIRQAICRSTISRCSCSRATAEVASGATSSRSARAGPRHSSPAARSSAAAAAASAGAHSRARPNSSRACPASSAAAGSRNR